MPSRIGWCLPLERRSSDAERQGGDVALRGVAHPTCGGRLTLTHRSSCRAAAVRTGAQPLGGPAGAGPFSLPLLPLVARAGHRRRGPQLSSTVRRRKVIRALRAILAVTVLGIILNVAVASVLAQIRVSLSGRLVVGSPSHSVTVLSRPGFELVTALNARAQPIDLSHSDVPMWCRLPPVPAMQRDKSTLSVRSGFGWPLISLWYSMDFEAGEPAKIAGAICLGAAANSSRVVLPYWVAWPGFAINTLGYAVAASLLLFGPRLLRNLMRRRRGQCTSCGYPFGGSRVCSECGTSREGRGVVA